MACDEETADSETKPWLISLVLASVILFAVSITAIALMFWQFSGPQCSDNYVILSLTLVLSVLATVYQLAVNTEQSLLASAIMTAYATYICYAAITLNPRLECNPSLASSAQTIASAIGMGITVLSLTWATRTAGGFCVPEMRKCYVLL